MRVDRSSGRIGAPGRWLAGSAGAGALGWVVLAAAAAVLPISTFDLDLVEVLLLVSPLVLVPMGLRISAPPPAGIEWRLYRWAAWTQPFGAALAAGSLVLPRGAPAALLAAPWAAVTLLVAASAAARLARMPRRRADEACLLAAHGYLAVGGLALVQSRAGLDFGGFGEVIVTLFAVHFLHAAFVGPVVAGLTGQLVARAWPRAWGTYRACALAVALGPALVAIGFVVGPVGQLLGVLVLAGGLLVLAAFLLAGPARIARSRVIQGLLLIGGLSLVPSMILAWLWALGVASGQATVGMDTMARVHGSLNALGFGACTLLAWNLLLRDDRP